MNSHRVKVLNRTDDYNIVLRVAHHLQFKLLPSDNRFLKEHLVYGRLIEPLFHKFHKVLFVIDNVTTGAAKGKGRPDYYGELYPVADIKRLFHG